MVNYSIVRNLSVSVKFIIQAPINISGITLPINLYEINVVIREETWQVIILPSENCTETTCWTEFNVMESLGAISAADTTFILLNVTATNFLGIGLPSQSRIGGLAGRAFICA